MRYTIRETIDTVAWSVGVANAPADIVLRARELAEAGNISTFGKLQVATDPYSFVWCVLTVNNEGQLAIAKRDTTTISSTTDS